MSQWTHPICDVCWEQRDPDRTPVRSFLPGYERCCYCGAPTRSGIYVREDPDHVIAHQEHTND